MVVVLILVNLKYVDSVRAVGTECLKKMCGENLQCATDTICGLLLQFYSPPELLLGNINVQEIVPISIHKLARFSCVHMCQL